MLELMRLGEQRDRRTCVAGVVSKRRYPLAGCIGQKLDVVERPSAACETGEIPVPVFLLLVAVSELNMRMMQ